MLQITSSELPRVRGQKVAIWDFDSGDSAARLLQEGDIDDVTARRPSNILTLNHETYEPTARDILPHAIAKLQAAGYRMVTLSECLGESPAAAYQSQGPPATVRFSHPSLATYSRYHRVLGAAKFSY
ncbi:Polysaccharide deacetylase [Rhizoctonia solani]|uniref:Polysaccharide deacetylase n=1 Tax=Rhizoctonia solani TaxID=456999 RepID=A0A8H7M5Z3_9AGAM|nr:Polysaccharide deacetylase [Rhizoctonia solani]